MKNNLMKQQGPQVNLDQIEFNKMMAGMSDEEQTKLAKGLAALARSKGLTEQPSSPSAPELPPADRPR